MREAVPVTEVGSQCRLTFKMPGIKSTDLKASVTSPTGKVNAYYFLQALGMDLAFNLHFNPAFDYQS